MLLSSRQCNLVQRARAMESDKSYLCLEAMGSWASSLSPLSLCVFGVLADLLRGLKQVMGSRDLTQGLAHSKTQETSVIGTGSQRNRY